MLDIRFDGRQRPNASSFRLCVEDLKVALGSLWRVREKTERAVSVRSATHARQGTGGGGNIAEKKQEGRGGGQKSGNRKAEREGKE